MSFAYSVLLSVVTTFVGGTTSGYVDGVGSEARFNYLTSVTIDLNNNLFIGDSVSQRVRRVTPLGGMCMSAVC